MLDERGRVSKFCRVDGPGDGQGAGQRWTVASKGAEGHHR